MRAMQLERQRRPGARMLSGSPVRISSIRIGDVGEISRHSSRRNCSLIFVEASAAGTAGAAAKKTAVSPCLPWHYMTVIPSTRAITWNLNSKH